MEKTNNVNKLDIDQLIGFLVVTRIDSLPTVAGSQSGGDKRH